MRAASTITDTIRENVVGSRCANSRARGTSDWSSEMQDDPNTILFGMCACGCGGFTTPYKRTRRELRHLEGQPGRYISGHSPRWAEYAKRREARFWERTKQVGECLEWTGALNPKGYGVLSYNNRQNVGAHRIAYELAVGPIPEGLTIDHLCRNKRCVRPEHLEVVTSAENVRRNALAFLSEDERDVIAAAEGSQSQIARQFGISQATVSKIKLIKRLTGRSIL